MDSSVKNSDIKVDQRTNSLTREDLAIVGIGCRFPGGVKDVNSFWELVVNGRDGVVKVPLDRWDADLFYDTDLSKPAKTPVRHGGFITHQAITDFDAQFFGISPREAEHIDPQQRLLLETSWEALENAGIPPDSLAGSNTGVFIGAFTFDNQISQMGIESRHLISSHTPTSSTFTMMSNRLSYFYDLRGPSVSVDTACSSSLVALHQACQSLWQGETDQALCGGANIIFRPETVISMSKGQFLAADGRSKSFDARADGYGRGEGAGIVLIKPISKALADGNRVYCLIKASGSNQDGRTNGITVPNPVSQMSLCRQVCKDANIEPSTIRFIEAHGTGTPVGDPIEANSLGSVYGAAQTDGDTVALGSIKANIGHTEAAAGIAGVIKACLSLHHNTIPPLANLEEPNPEIPFEELGLHLPREPEVLSRGTGPSRAAVNSFGYGGTNAHVILERFATAAEPTGATLSAGDSGEHYFTVSARDTSALRDLVAAYVKLLDSDITQLSLAQLCTQMARQRSHLPYRLIVRCASLGDLRTRLQSYLDDGLAEQLTTGKAEQSETAKPVFVYTGMGPQWWGMGRDLMATEPAFRDAIDTCDQIFQRFAGWSIAEELSRDEHSSRMMDTQIAQPANFVVQYALTRLLLERGITPAAIVGHSVGEVTAACVAGVLSLEDAVSVSFHRSRIQKKAAGQGSMLAAGVPETEVASLLLGYEDQVSIAAVNSPGSVTLAGETTAIESIAERLEDQGLFNRLLQVEVPYHSHYMEPLKQELTESLAHLSPSLSDTPLYSTVTGERVSGVLYDAAYWCDNVREPVLFAKAITAAIGDGHSLFLEVGPHPVLSTSIKECLSAQGVAGASVATLRRNQPENETFEQCIPELYCSGMTMDWGAARTDVPGALELPLYPFQREHYWLEAEEVSSSRLGASNNRHPLLLRRQTSDQPTWWSPLVYGLLPYLPDHQVDGVVVFPGAGYLEAVLAMNHELTGSDSCVLTDIDFSRALVIEQQDPILSIRFNPSNLQFQVHSRASILEDSWTAHATGIVSAVASEAPSLISLESLQAVCKEHVNVDELYQQLASRGLVYGEHFQRIVSIARNEFQSLARIEPHPEQGRNAHKYCLHPTMLDACFQSLIALVDPDLGGGNTFVPVHIDRLALYASPKGAFWCVGELLMSSSQSITGHLTLFDDEGTVIAQVRGFRCQAMAGASQSLQSLLKRCAYEVNWEPLDLPSQQLHSATILVIADSTTDEQNLLTQFENINEMQAQGQTSLHIVSATQGQEFSALNKCRYACDFNDQESIVSLLNTVPDCSVIVRWPEADQCSDELDGLDAVQGMTHILGAVESVGINPRVYGVSRDAVSVAPADAVEGISLAPFIGLLSVANNEYPDLRCTTIDIDSSLDSLPVLVNELLADTPENAVVVRDGNRFGRRVVRTSQGERDNTIDTGKPQDAPSDTAFELVQTSSGSLDSIALRACNRQAPGPGEVEVKVVATSLNFKDVAKAMNLMADEALEGTFHGKGLGLEASGHIVRIGEGVSGVNIGDAVVCSTVGCFRRYAIVKADGLMLSSVPADRDLVEYAGITTVFATACHTLCDVARLEAGERVLIHAGAGGVGLAAIKVAQAIGAEIFATAGTEEKREYLRSIGVPHVMNSRTLEFAEQIERLTDGQGVDVVLNSLPQEYIHKSLQSLAPFGRFVEIGKKDLVMGTEISLTPFNKVLSFSSFDFDLMVEQKPDLAREIVTSLIQRFRDGELEPVETTVFPASELSAAFKFMARSQHIGKVVVDWTAEETVKLLPSVQSSRMFKADAAYLITGGLGGFGLSLAQWLVEQGVSHLVLAGRSGAATEEARSAISAMQAQGAEIHVHKLDITDSQQVQALVKQYSQSEASLKGVFHAAAVLDDAPIDELDRARYEQVMRPKILGAKHLDLATRELDLDFFVLFSSVASVVGNARQANYVAANTWLDAFAAQRHARGLPATSINWGPIADVGMAADNELLSKTLAATGFTATRVPQGMQMLEHVLQWSVAQQGLFEVDWSTWASVSPASGSSPTFANLVASDSDDLTDNPLYQELLQMPAVERADVVGYILIEKIAETLRLPADKLDPGDSIADLGMDSLMAVELQMSVRQTLGVELAALEMMKVESIGQMALLVLRKLGLEPGDDDAQLTAVEDVLPSVSADDVDDMTDEEVDQILEMATD